MSTATKAKTAKKWTCDQCGVSIAQIDGSRVDFPRPGTATRTAPSASTAGVTAPPRRRWSRHPEDSPIEVRAKLRRAALIEFEVSRRPDHGDGAIAKACRSSVSAVAAARQRLKLPAPEQQPQKRR